MTSKKHYAYISIWQKRDDANKGFAVSTDLEKLRNNPTNPVDGPAKDETEETAEPRELDGALDSTITRIIGSNHSQSELFSMSSFLVEGYPGMFLEHNVISRVEKSSDVVETLDKATIYGLSEHEFERLLLRLRRMQRVATGLKALRPF